MLHEHNRVVLTEPITDLGLENGDVGTIVHVHAGGAAYEVEFVSLDGETSIVSTVKASALRSVLKREIPHVRQLAVA
jgi:hypothetical protein